MKNHRHPHPHKDPRQPRHQTAPGTNPPVFAWKPEPHHERFRLQVAQDEAFARPVLDLADLAESVYLPTAAFQAGHYYWRWCAGAEASEVFAFEIRPDAVVLEVPAVEEWLLRFPSGHPRLYLRPEDVAALRESRAGARAALWSQLQAQADARLAEPHEIAEPDYLPNRAEDYGAFFRAFSKVMWESRNFVRGAEALALAHLASGEPTYARAACQRLASMAQWDPEGSSHLAHNDEAHMPIIWHGPTACDWVWDQFTDAERERVVAHLRRRGQITYEHMHDRGPYGVVQFGSHSGREIVFLAQVALLIHEHAAEAKTWLEWLRPVLCGIWPVWAGDDGAWAEGPSYGLAYVTIMTLFATGLKAGAGVDLYQRPFWKNHAAWRQRIFPPYAEWIGFGDHSERWGSTWEANANLVGIISRQTGTAEFGPYIARLRDEAKHAYTPPIRLSAGISPQRYILADPPAEADTRAEAEPVLRTFPAAGWAAVRTHMDDPDSDVALVFRSSPFGAISHSHANNNDFILHVAGKAMAMPSGYYDGYGSPHHAHWVWHTKSHNCLTLSDAGQITRSHDSCGAVEHPFEDDALAYFMGNADTSYSDRATRCRRHVVYLKAAGCFVMVDDFVARPGITSSVQWNIHSWSPFEVDKAGRSFRLQRDQSVLDGHFLCHHDAFFSLSEGWDPPPLRVKDDSQWGQQYHLRFTPHAQGARCRLGVVLSPSSPMIARTSVATERHGAAEVAHVGDAVVLVNQGDRMEYGDVCSGADVVVVAEGQRYEFTSEGLAC